MLQLPLYHSGDHLVHHRDNNKYNTHLKFVVVYPNHCERCGSCAVL